MTASRFNGLRYASIMIIMVVTGIGLSAQEMSVRAALDTNRALIGDQLKLRLKLEKPGKATVTFPGLQDTLAEKIEIISKSSIDTVRGRDGRETLTQEMLIAVFDTGFFEIPPLPFAFRNGQISDTLSTLPVYFEIQAMPVDTTIRDIRANMKAPVNAAEILPFALAATVLALAGYLVYLWIRRRKRKTAGIEPEIPSEPEDVIALRELARLREEKPWLHRQVKLYYIRMTEILRRYIERRYDIMALEQTTDEILASLRKAAIGSTVLQRLSGILKLADLVKFAKVIPDDEENAAQLEEAIVFVNETALLRDDTGQEGTMRPEPVRSNVES